MPTSKGWHQYLRSVHRRIEEVLVYLDQLEVLEIATSAGALERLRYAYAGEADAV